MTHPTAHPTGPVTPCTHAAGRENLGVTHAPPGRLSDVLHLMALDTSRTHWSVADLLLALKDRALGAMILLLALPNVLPVPPGTSTVLGAPLLLLTAQLMLARRPWLPGFIARRQVAQPTLAALVLRGLPWIRRAESLLRPRWVVLTRPPVEQAVGAVCLLMALLLFLPIPLGNMLPALTLCVLALGILARDGVWVVLGTLLAATSAAMVWGVLYALFHAALFIVRGALGG